MFNFIRKQKRKRDIKILIKKIEESKNELIKKTCFYDGYIHALKWILKNDIEETDDKFSEILKELNKNKDLDAVIKWQKTGGE